MVMGVEKTAKLWIYEFRTNNKICVKTANERNECTSQWIIITKMRTVMVAAVAAVWIVVQNLTLSYMARNDIVMYSTAAHLYHFDWTALYCCYGWWWCFSYINQIVFIHFNLSRVWLSPRFSLHFSLTFSNRHTITYTHTNALSPSLSLYPPLLFFCTRSLLPFNLWIQLFVYIRFDA